MGRGRNQSPEKITRYKELKQYWPLKGLEFEISEEYAA
jgi:hypothetical protein